MFLIDIFLVLSNLVFFIPAYRAVKYRRWTRAAIYFSIVFVSGMYHTCRSYSDLCIFNFKVHYDLDLFFAQLCIPLAVLYLIDFPIWYQWVERWLLFVFAFIIFVLQMFTGGALQVQLVLIGGSFIVLGAWLLLFKNKNLNYDWVMLERGIILTAMSTSLFTIQDRYMQGFWAVHSLWHVLAAFGQYYILAVKPKAPVYAAIDKKVNFVFRNIPRI